MKSKADRTHQLNEGPFAYVGDGLGVPGLPSPITMSEAQAVGLGDLLAQALENGAFAPIGPAIERTAPAGAGPQE